MRILSPPPGLESFWSALAPRNTPWVFIGGSYPGEGHCPDPLPKNVSRLIFISSLNLGIRAVLARKRNPETWYASWASSAPVQAQIDMSVYYNVMQQAMPRNCSTDVHAAVTFADIALEDETSVEAAQARRAIYMMGLLASINAPGRQTSLLPPHMPFPSSPSDMSSYIAAQILAIPFQHTSRSFQMLGFSESLQSLCDDLEQYNVADANEFYSNLLSENDSLNSWIELFEKPLLNKSKPTNVGIATKYNSSWAFNAFLSALYRKFSEEDNMKNAPLLGSSPYPADRISWVWQYCTEFGFFQVANTSNPLNFISRFLNVSSTQSLICRSAFPYPEMPAQPLVGTINRFGGWNVSVSNVRLKALCRGE